MGSQQDVDVKSEVVSDEKSSEENEGGPPRLVELQGQPVDPEDPKPQRTCGVTPPPKNTSGGAVPVQDEQGGQEPAPQFQCGVRKPPTNVSGGRKPT